LAAGRRRAIEALPATTSPIDRYLGALPRRALSAVAGAGLVLALFLALRWGAPGLDGAGDATLAAGGGSGTSGGAERAAGADAEAVALIDAGGSILSPADLELLAGGDPEVLVMLEDGLEFYAWLEQQPELAPSGEARRP